MRTTVVEPAPLGKAGEVRHKLVRWFWCSVFNQSYDNAANSQAAKDLLEVGSWLEGRPAPASIKSFSFESAALHEVTPKQRALYTFAEGEPIWCYDECFGRVKLCC